MYLRKNYIKTIDYDFETNTYKIIRDKARIRVSKNLSKVRYPVMKSMPLHLVV